MLDASALVHSSCLLRLKRIVMDGLTMKQVPNDIVYGSAFHKFVATMYEKKGDFGYAIKCAMDIWNKPKYIRNKWLTDHHLQNTCIDYWQHFQTKDNFQVLSSDGKPLVEFDFCNRYYEDDNFEIDLVGTIDKLGKIPNGIYAFGDYKTTSLHSITKNGKSGLEFEVKAFFDKYDLSLQLNFYAFNLMLKCKQQPNHPISKLFENQPMGYFIDGVFMSKSEKTMFKRSNINQFTEDNFNEFKQILDYKIVQIVNAFKTDWTIRDGLISGACVDGKYKCKFHEVCCATDKEAKQYMLNQFDKKPYNPLMFSK